MHSPLTDRHSIRRLVLLFSLVYMASYITRTNFGAVISELELSTGFSRSALSGAVTASFISYGIGQLISGFLGDKISPKRLVGAGLFLSALMNLLIPFTTAPYQMTVIWCINGFAQSLLWPPLVKLLTVFLSDEDFKDGSTSVSLFGTVGTVAVYLISPLLIFLFSYRAVFFFGALVGLLMLLFWMRFAPDTSNYKKTEIKSEFKPKKYNILTPLMLFIFLAITLQGMLRDGVTTWMPTYISDTYLLGGEISILSGVCLPIFSIVCIKITSFIYKRWVKNPLTLAAIIFAIGAASAFLLSLTNGHGALFSVILSALLTGSMYGVNLLLVCMLPGYFKSYSNVAFITGAINCATYVGSAASTFGFALLSEELGWSFTILLWLAAAILGTLICLLTMNKFKNKCINNA